MILLSLWCVSEAAVQYHRHVYSIRNCLFVCFSVTLVKPEKPLKVPKIKDSYKSVRYSATIVSICDKRTIAYWLAKLFPQKIIWYNLALICYLQLVFQFIPQPLWYVYLFSSHQCIHKLFCVFSTPETIFYITLMTAKLLFWVYHFKDLSAICTLRWWPWCCRIKHIIFSSALITTKFTFSPRCCSLIFFSAP